MRYLKSFAAISIGVATNFLFQDYVSRPLRVEFLEQSIKEYSQLIVTFEADRARLVQAEAVDDESERPRIREQLTANQRGLELLQEALARVKLELIHEQSQSESD